MHLKSLTIRGFKSFADRSQLKFEPGVTVIVGPNGSGKSNITDAALWVLGEQSAKQLRGGAMEDVIFAGSDGRSALGVAEVTLVLDNSDHTLPIEFAEVSVTRRLYRSGESDYLINQSPCRLLDIQELLSDSGLGRETYSIISQGRLEDTLNGRPEDRRVLIEEAAGVLKHKKRKERALRKLLSMDEHATRAKDILREVNRQLRPLKSQATQAERYRELTDQLRELEVDASVLELKDLQAQWNDIIDSETALSASTGTLRQKQTALEERSSKLQDELEVKDSESGAVGEKKRRASITGERLAAGRTLLEEKGRNLEVRLSSARERRQEAQRRAGRQQKELALAEEEGAATEKRLAELYAELADQRKRTETARKLRLEVEGGVEALTAQLRGEEMSLGQVRERQHALELEIGSQQRETEFVRARVQELAKTQGTFKKEVTDLERNAKRKDKDVTRLAEETAQAVEAASETRDLAGAQELRLASLTADLAQLRARRTALEEVRHSLGGFAVEEGELKDLGKKFGLVGVLKDLIEVPRPYEAAVEAALGNNLFCLVVKSRKDIPKAVALLPEAVSMSLLPLDCLNARAAEMGKMVSHTATDGGVAAGRPAVRAAEVVKTRPALRAVVDVLLGGVYLVEDLESALEFADGGAGRQDVVRDMWGGRATAVVSRRGDIVTGYGKTVVSRGQSAGKLLGQKRELAELEARVCELAALVDSQAAELERLKGQHSDCINRQTEAKTALGRAEMEKEACAEALAKARGRFQASLEQQKDLEEKAKGLTSRSVSEAKEIKDLAETFKEKQAATVELKEMIERLDKARAIRVGEETKVTGELATCQAELNSLAAGQGAMRRRVHVIESEIRDAGDIVAREQGLIRRLELFAARAAPMREICDAIGRRLDEVSEVVMGKARGEETAAAEIRQSLKETQSQLAGVSEEMGRLSTKVAEVELAKGQLEVKVTSVVEGIVEEHSMPIEKALQKDIGMSRDECLERAAAARRKIASLGPVNPIATSQFQELDDRQVFLTSQIDDLLRSKQAIGKVVAAIDNKIRDLFLEAFDRVNENFKEVFSYLFPGGSAELVLTDPENFEETGVDIRAQPVGKKLQRMSLLSGGEKALVAVALLFAVYHTRPSPFYILDEVEAALDDINLQRFIELLRRLRTRTQFLVITHQRRTMEMADVLYGVSMQADGVSRLLSQKLDQAEQAAG